MLTLSPATTKMCLELGTSGVAVCTATACTNPIDVVKIRIQLASTSAGPASLGLLSTGASVIRNEGARLPEYARSACYVRGRDGAALIGCTSMCTLRLPAWWSHVTGVDRWAHCARDG